MNDNDTPTILALDASSTMIGFVVYAGTVLAHGEHKLSGGDIACRCQTARDILALLLDRYPAVAVVAIESPVLRFAGCIPQIRVSGALLGLVAERVGLLWCEVPPAQAKRALTGHGNATKDAMQQAAACYGVSGEHAADAVGVALASLKQIRVVTSVDLQSPLVATR